MQSHSDDSLVHRTVQHSAHALAHAIRSDSMDYIQDGTAIQHCTKAVYVLFILPVL